MSETLRESIKPDVALAPQSIATSNVTGQYYDLRDYDKAMFILQVGAIPNTDADDTVEMQVYKRKADGTGAVALTSYVATVTGQVNASKATVLVDTVTNDETLEINGITYTKKAGTDADAQEFADAAGLVLCVNHATLGVPGVTASAVGTTVTLVADNPGKTLITLVGYEASKLIPYTAEATAIVEVPEDVLGTDFTHVAVKVTTSATIVVGATLIRCQARREPVDQQVADVYPA